MGEVAYRLVLPLYLSRVNNVFHVSMIYNYKLAQVVFLNGLS